MIEPSSLNLSALPSVPFDARHALPTAPAIYFALNGDGSVQYIGRSVNPKQRWVSHHRYDDLANLDNVRIAYLFVDDVDLLPHIETALIHWFKPPLNVAYPGLKVGLSGMLGLRLRAGKLPEQVAVALGISVSTVHKWDQGKTVPRMTANGFLRLMDVYGCTLEELAEAERSVKFGA